jgi:hypothetical protein
VARVGESSVTEDAGLELDPFSGADVEAAPHAPAWGLFALGVLALVGAGGALLLQEALPERFPSLLEMVMLRPALTGVPSDFFPPSAWALALLSWGLLALALAVGHRLALRAGSPLETGGLESVALVLVPGLGLVGGPYVLRALGKAAESRKVGLRLRLGERAVVAVLLYVGAVALAIAEARSPGELAHGAALAARLLSGVAFCTVLAGAGRAFGVLARSGSRPVGREASEARSASALVWAGMLVATGAAVAGVWFFRSEWRACEPGTTLRHTAGQGSERVSACVLPDGRRQGPEWIRRLDGRLLASGEYQAGQRHGTFRTLGEKGALLEERTYIESRPHGTWTLYQADGERLLAEGYADGLLEGPSTLYHPNGHPRFLKNYQKGVAHGRHATWFESGQVEVEGAYEQGKPSGPWAQQDKEGKVIKQWNAGGTTSEDTAGVALLASSGAALRAGHTPRWWKERLELLRDRAAKDPAFVVLYELTLRRARANGFAVVEKPEGLVLALQPVP